MLATAQSQHLGSRTRVAEPLLLPLGYALAESWPWDLDLGTAVWGTVCSLPAQQVHLLNASATVLLIQWGPVAARPWEIQYVFCIHVSFFLGQVLWLPCAIGTLPEQVLTA